MSWQKKVVLITGGAGYIGSVLVRRLLECGYKVKVLDNLDFGFEAIRDLLNNPNFELIKANLLNVKTFTKAFKEVKWVAHLAGIRYNSSKTSEEVKDGALKDFLATQSLVTVAKDCGVKRFLFASSCSVYGVGNLLTEMSAVRPLTFYAEAKLKSEKHILTMADSNFTPVILRLGTVYGWSMGMRFDLVLNRFVTDALESKKIIVFGGNQWRPFIHCMDVANAFIAGFLASEKKIQSEIFNVGSTTENYQISQLARTIEALIPNIDISIAQGSGDDIGYRVDFTKFATRLSFKAKYCIRDGVREIKRVLNDRRNSEKKS